MSNQGCRFCSKTGVRSFRTCDSRVGKTGQICPIFSNTRGKVGSRYGLTSDLRGPVFRERGEIHAGGEIGPAGPVWIFKHRQNKSATCCIFQAFVKPSATSAKQNARGLRLSIL